MYSSKVRVSAIALLVGMGMVGCTSPNGPASLPEQDQLSIQNQISTDPLFSSDRQLLDDRGDNNPLAMSALGKTETPILPLRWGRKITSVDRSVAYDQLNDSTVVATVTHTLTGMVVIRARYSALSRDTLIFKPVVEVTTRKIIFYRIENPMMPSIKWRPREVSATKGGTVNSAVTINEVDVFAGSDTLVITDPLAYFLKLPTFHGRPMPVIGAASNTPFRVRVTLTSSSPDTDIVRLHRPWVGMFWGFGNTSMKLVSQTQTGASYSRVFEYTWNSHFPGRYHFFVSAITRSSLFDDSAPFSSQIWGVPYIVQ